MEMARNTNWKGRLSADDLLIKAAFWKKVGILYKEKHYFQYMKEVI
jgi:hypothetical protein